MHSEFALKTKIMELLLLKTTNGAKVVFAPQNWKGIKNWEGIKTPAYI